MDTVTSRGKTVEEAISLALETMKAQKNEVDIQIIANESRGMMGIGAKPAVVRVKKKDKSMDLLEEAVKAIQVSDEQSIPRDHSESSAEESLLPVDGLLGMVWVKEGHIFCKDAPDKYPLVQSGKGISFYKNGELVEDMVIVSENDLLRVELKDETAEPSWELKVSNDKMEVVLKVVPGLRTYRKLKDKPPSQYLELEFEESRIPITLQTGPIMEKLRDLGIVYGISYTEIASACVSETAASFVIARGTPPIPGKHGIFKPLLKTEVQKGLKERSDGTVDYREIQEFPSIERGQVIGVAIPPEPGIYGTAVTNEHVFPPEVSPLVLKEGRGVFLVEDGTKVLAKESGHPEIVKKGQMAVISISPKLTIGKDLDLQTGNVHYHGDVEICGSVQDGMLVEAQGNTLIWQNVNMSQVHAGTSVIVRSNIIASEIAAGKSTYLKAEIAQFLGELTIQMKQMAEAINQLSTVAAFKATSFTVTGLGPLIKILCDGKFKNFHGLLKECLDRIKSGSGLLEEEWAEFHKELTKGFLLPLSSHFKSLDDLYRLIRIADLLHSSLQATEEDEACFIKASFAHNSRLYCSGDIFLTGHGCYNSMLRSGRSVMVDGFVRGGEIYAAKEAILGEAGTKGGISTRITVPKEGTIRIKIALEDTIIQVGAKIHRFLFQTSDVHARLDERGVLILS